jgi:hypothetical protein
MSLKTIFLMCFAIVCLPAIGWSTWIAARAQSDWAHATAAVRMAEAMGDALRLLESVSIESGLLQESLLSDGPISGNLAAASARHDVLLDNAQRSMQRARLPDDAVTRSREVFSVARTQVAEAISHPLSERDPVAMRTIVAQLYERRAAIAGAVARAERDAAQADARVGELVAVGSLAVDIRAAPAGAAAI